MKPTPTAQQIRAIQADARKLTGTLHGRAKALSNKYPYNIYMITKHIRSLRLTNLIKPLTEQDRTRIVDMYHELKASTGGYDSVIYLQVGKEVNRSWATVRNTVIASRLPATTERVFNHKQDFV